VPRWKGGLVRAVVSVVSFLVAAGLAPWGQVASVSAAPLGGFAPYYGTWAGTPLTKLASASGVRHLTLAFLLGGSGGCRATWNGSTPVAAGDAMGAQIAALKGMGGDVILSFGGANGPYLDQFCGSPAAEEKALQAVVDAYHVTHLDFDIEAMWDAGTLNKRSRAIAMLERARGVDVSLTLPILQTGLIAQGLAAVRSAASNGANISVVNAMTMDYGGPVANMGQAAISAATALHGQLKTIYPGRSDAALWAMVGITPMIGPNDSAGENFTQANARAVQGFAKAHGVGRVSMWQISRDPGYAYSHIFNH